MITKNKRQRQAGFFLAFVTVGMCLGFFIVEGGFGWLQVIATLNFGAASVILLWPDS